MVDRTRSRDKRGKNALHSWKIFLNEIEIKVLLAIRDNPTSFSVMSLSVSMFCYSCNCCFYPCFSSHLFLSSTLIRQKWNTLTTITSITWKVLCNGYDSLAFRRIRARYLHLLYYSVLYYCVIEIDWIKRQLNTNIVVHSKVNRVSEKNRHFFLYKLWK